MKLGKEAVEYAIQARIRGISYDTIRLNLKTKFGIDVSKAALIKCCKKPRVDNQIRESEQELQNVLTDRRHDSIDKLAEIFDTIIKDAHGIFKNKFMSELAKEDKRGFARFFLDVSDKILPQNQGFGPRAGHGEIIINNNSFELPDTVDISDLEQKLEHGKSVKESTDGKSD